jgi:hypothetical protein
MAETGLGVGNVIAGVLPAPLRPPCGGPVGVSGVGGERAPRVVPSTAALVAELSSTIVSDRIGGAADADAAAAASDGVGAATAKQAM